MYLYGTQTAQLCILFPGLLNRIFKTDPFDGVISDPNPLATDPYYDVAYYLNLKEAWGKKKIALTKDIFIGSYFKNTIEPTDFNRLAALRAFTAIYRILSTIDRREYSRAALYRTILIDQLSLINQ